MQMLPVGSDVSPCEVNTNYGYLSAPLPQPRLDIIRCHLNDGDVTWESATTGAFAIERRLTALPLAAIVTVQGEPQTDVGADLVDIDVDPVVVAEIAVMLALEFPAGE